MTATGAQPLRFGFASVVGRPNVGKSTLTNALVGQKVAITSARPQTTRHAVRGVVHRPAAGQLVLVDTPGLHRPRTLLGERLNDVVRSTLTEVDAVLFCVPADQRPGPGDRYLAGELSRSRAPVVAVLTKVDLVSPDRVAGGLLALSGLGGWTEVLPVSATTGFQTELLVDLLLRLLPEGPPMYPDGHLTDEPEQTMVAELVREAALADLREELPHSVAVAVDEMITQEGSDVVAVHVTIFVERASQKGILIGSGGDRLRRIGTESRRHIEALLGSRVYLDLHVTVAKDWQRDPKQLRRLGF